MPASDERQPRLRSAIVFGLAALTRPEGTLLFALTVAHRGLVMLMRRRITVGAPELRWLGLFAAIVVPHFLWRRWYYGWWLPNTFYIKSSGVGGTWQQGGYYLMRVVENFHLWTVPLLAIAALVVDKSRGLRVVVGYATLVVSVFALYVASVGGDFMGLYRFVMPVIPLLAVVAALSLRALCASLPAPAAVAIVVVLLGLHAWHAFSVDKRALVAFGPGASDRGIDTPGFLRRYTADRATVGKWFATWARPDDYAAVGGAGAQVYFSGIRSLDCFGLSDEFIAHKLPAHSSRPGHEKYATDEYILSKHPTIITSGNYRFSYGPYVGADASVWAQRGYHYVSVRIPGLIEGPYYSFLLRNDRPAPPGTSEREP